ncbi:MAG: uroporphyrinogen-III C-methyltransferase [Propionibacteriaceae bacterium]
MNLDLVVTGRRVLVLGSGRGTVAVVSRALAGDQVVRRKGGDPYVFGRGREEVQACLDLGSAVEVVPGSTSAVAVPAAAGIPVTHRGVSAMFTVVSGHDRLSEAEFTHLAGLRQTIVVLMGMLAWPQLQAGLIRAGLAADTPAAIVERGYSATQRSTIATLGELTQRIASISISSPAVVVVGEVVRLAPTDPLTAGLWAGVADVLAEPAGES